MGMKQISMRLPEDFLEEMDQLAPTVKNDPLLALSGGDGTRADILRLALHRGFLEIKREIILRVAQEIEFGQPVNDALDEWDGKTFELYRVLGGTSATLEVAQRICRENQEKGNWGLNLGPKSFLLSRPLGNLFAQLLTEAGVNYDRRF